MHVREFIDEMERIAPPGLAEEFDEGRIGLIVEGKKTIGTICCALDATPTVVKQAAAARADMLVVHHTPIWTPLTTLTGQTAALMRDVLAAGMNIWVMHTNFDHAESGVNDALAELLSLENTAPLELGMVGDCPMTVKEISRRLDCPLRIWGKMTKTGPVGRIAVAGGSGFDLLLMEEAKGKGALAFLSSELKHSICRAAPLPCIEATHYALETPAMKRLAARKGWIFIADPPVLNTIP
ncbi:MULTISPECIES: Nif3-like dinuclear metal center hexameric protein [unclassified Methanoregula]|uniref:Nif3-like dinuclear metal center hexameric protein n=1 Tax=unclassified Methanoregula TaxID=2649730 RepID=UPI0009D0167A|nr:MULTISPECIES: Nif3-like dinuclear metal center hexameric protein [unclassified Methanoregula]OPX65242.1 MAG: metal-binding protein [Methanoregula sp. PtaB.Bin085]OPY32151.1 MAG: metal-binding protein [Methanoregula sp. PtaU1.Bin006]